MDKKQIFVLEIMDNQKDTWQGKLRWLQGQKESSFRSVLELLRLIDSTIDDDPDFDKVLELPEGNLWNMETVDT